MAQALQNKDKPKTIVTTFYERMRKSNVPTFGGEANPKKDDKWIRDIVFNDAFLELLLSKLFKDGERKRVLQSEAGGGKFVPEVMSSEHLKMMRFEKGLLGRIQERLSSVASQDYANAYQKSIRVEGSIPWAMGKLDLLTEVQFDANLTHPVAAKVACLNRKIVQWIGQTGSSDSYSRVTSSPVPYVHQPKKYVIEVSRHKLAEKSSDLQATLPNGEASLVQFIYQPSIGVVGHFLQYQAERSHSCLLLYHLHLDLCLPLFIMHPILLNRVLLQLSHQKLQIHETLVTLGEVWIYELYEYEAWDLFENLSDNSQQHATFSHIGTSRQIGSKGGMYGVFQNVDLSLKVDALSRKFDELLALNTLPTNSPNVQGLEVKTQILDSHTQSIAELETQIGQLANPISRRDEGKLPSHPIENPRANHHEQAKTVITLRNGKLVDNKVGEPTKDRDNFYGLPKAFFFSFGIMFLLRSNQVTLRLRYISMDEKSTLMSVFYINIYSIRKLCNLKRNCKYYKIIKNFTLVHSCAKNF
ncbi:hypothetical protein M9H77_13253 [Catharanthus roseus]|uniref:Uncharacterized protein n=1 Tax=Catharanthus roseus TaxID=4058 RepID=A0ACC0BJL9_CATRO|nr:hypothetical protein M9H77_13253 [Catharanthus roseus]